MRGAAGAAVIAREAVRASRRWQTYALRFGFAAALFLLVLFAWTEQVDSIMDDPAAAARMGHNLFTLYVTAQVVLVSVIAPVLVGQGIAEEREDGTLQLLTLTRLTAGQILWSKLSSRLMILATVVASSMPILALTLTFGGVGVYEAINAVSVTLLLVLLFGAIGGFAALTSSGGVASLVSAVGYALAVLGIGPAMLMFGYEVFSGRGPRRPPDWFHPGSAFFSQDLEAIWVWAVYLPAILGLGVLAAPVFRMATSDDPEEEEFGALSPEIWQIERFKRLALLIGMAWLAGSLMMVLTSRLTPDWIWQLERLVQTSGFTFVLTVAWVFAFQGGSQLVAGFFRTRGYEVEREYGGTAHRLSRRLRERVWPNPVAWREVVTRGQGAGALVGRYGLVAWAALSLPFVVLSELDDDILILSGFAGMAVGLVATGLSAAGAYVPERRAGTLPLLATTTLSPGAAVRGKLFAVAVHGFPLFAAGALVLTLGVFEPWELDRYRRFQMLSYAEPYCPGTPESGSVQVGLAARLGLMAVWVPAAWLSAASAALLVAARLRPAGLAWGVSLGVALAWFPVPIMAMAAMMGRKARHLVRMWAPFASDSWSSLECMPRPEWLPSTAVHLGLALLALGTLQLFYRRWATV